MVNDDSARQNTDKITSGITPGISVAKVIEFVRQQLPTWRDDSDRPDEQAEDKLNLQLCKFLDARARFEFEMVCFHHEEYQTDRRRVDISASSAKPTVIEARPYTIYDPILVFEGKRLPPPSSDRQREYVTGNEDRNGGIQRFKLGLHGAKLDIAVMIGYVQKRSPHDWHQNINQWISDLASDPSADVCKWDAEEILGTLEEDTENAVSSCESQHDRTGDCITDTIKLRHLWVVMAARKPSPTPS